MRTIVFWGAGKIGKRMQNFWQQLGLQPDFFADNREELSGTVCQGVRVISAEELKKLDKVFILITCNETEAIRTQLLEYGISGEDIFKGNTVWDMLSFLTLYRKEQLRWNKEKDRGKLPETNLSGNVLFDLQGGFVLGGVEAWAMQMAEVLSAQEVKSKFIIPDQLNDVCRYDDNDVIQLNYPADFMETDRCIKCLSEIHKCLPCNIVCNFPFYTYMAACLAKILWPREVNLIAIVHNDLEVYYERYSQMQEIIDYCLVTCDAMEERFIQGGMPKEKIDRIAWEIPGVDTLNRTYSKAGQPIRIGYAGRIVINQKRMDVLIEIIKRLKEAEADFQLELAGSGDYEEEMKEILSDVSGQIHFRGCLAREQMAEFWKNQDIGINCSDFEGRCISKAESMAAGAVPVITDTSSARDDVQDGYNGFVVPVGDVEGMVEKICYLYHHREQLEVMGRRSHEFIKKENKESNVLQMWHKILKFQRM